MDYSNILYLHISQTIPSILDEDLCNLLDYFRESVSDNGVQIRINKSSVTFFRELDTITPDTLFMSKYRLTDFGVAIPINMECFLDIWETFNNIRDYIRPYIHRYLQVDDESIQQVENQVTDICLQ
jgi:hypothetical protein